jgi:hypothetical protein
MTRAVVKKTDPYRSKNEFANDLAGMYEEDRQKVADIWEERARECGIELERGSMTFVEYLWELRRQVRAADDNT